MYRVVTLLLLSLIATVSNARNTEPHNAIIFVADGLRGSMVDAALTPNMDALRKAGVSFPNSHSLFPTVTMANASAISTGHYLGDTGNFANTIYSGFELQTGIGAKSVTPFLEDDVVLGQMDAHFAANYLSETSLLALARKNGFSTAALGKVGPTLVQDHTERSGLATIILDDRSGLVSDNGGEAEGIALSSEMSAALNLAGLPLTPPSTDRPNVAQQAYFIDVATRVVLPLFQKRGKPFVLVLWMRDPDTSQHSQLDSRYGLVPGINGSTSLQAIRNTDTNLGQVRQALKRLNLERDTDIFVTSDHGFSTISKTSDTSHSLKCHFDDVPAGFLPPGFLALDLANALELPLRDPDARNELVENSATCDQPGTSPKPGTPVLAKHPRSGSGLIGRDAQHPDLIVTTGAGAGLIYLTSDAGRAYVRAIAAFLLNQDYVGGLFVDDSLGRIPGTLPLSAIGLVGHARTPRPAMIVSFRSFSTGCDQPLRCGVEVSDTTLSQGQGMHGSFSRADTFNFMAAIGPDFREHFVDPAPASNADVAPTLARVLHLDFNAQGLAGRSLAEALPDGKMPEFQARTCLYRAVDLGRGPALDQPPLLHLQPALRLQAVGSTHYFDAAGIQGRTLGLETRDGEACVE